MATNTDPAQLDEARQPIDEEDFPRLVRARIQEWESHTARWREEARANFDAVAGRQWSDADREAMERLGRPMVTLNSLAAMVRAICGLEINSRQAVTYYGRYAGAGAKAETLTQAVKYARDECNAEDEESAAFRDMVICGMGFTEIRIAYDDNPAGEVWIERLDPLACAWDPSARRRGLQDARWLATWRDIPRVELERLWPDKAEEVANVFWPAEMSVEIAPHDATNAAWYPSSAVASLPRNTARVVQYQYWRETAFVRVFAPDGASIDVPAAQAERARAAGLRVQKLRPRREYRQAILTAGVVLEDEPLPVSAFSIGAMTGMTDRNEGIWYGFVRDLVDPQRFINKFVSLAVDILAANAKGGLMAEATAFVNQRKAEEDWANPTKIVWLRDGGIDRVRERNAVAFPPALTQLMQFAVEGMPRISGVNLEFLGAADRNQPGVLEYQRKQSVVSGLAEFFGALRLYRKIQGKVLAKYVAKVMGDGRLVRVTGPQGAQYVPLIMAEDATEYDLVVDEAPSAPDTKARTWAALIDILPAAMKMGIPVPPEILDYSPLPASLAERWKQMLAGNRAQLPPEVQAQMVKMGEEMTRLAEENTKLKANTEAKLLQLQAERELKLEELRVEGQSKIADLNLRAQIAELDANIERERAIAELALEREKMLAELSLKQAAQSADLGAQAAQAAARHELAREDMAASREIERERVAATLKAPADGGEAREANLAKIVERIAALSEQIAELQKPKRKQIILRHDGQRISGAEVIEEGGARQTLTVTRKPGAKPAKPTPKETA